MKAIVCTEYGPPEALKLEEIQKPTPRDGEVLVKIHAASVTYSNLTLVRGEPFVGRLMGMGLLKPKHQIPGADFAGTVDAVGENVTQFRPEVPWRKLSRHCFWVLWYPWVGIRNWVR